MKHLTFHTSRQVITFTKREFLQHHHHHFKRTQPCGWEWKTGLFFSEKSFFGNYHANFCYNIVSLTPKDSKSQWEASAMPAIAFVRSGASVNAVFAESSDGINSKSPWKVNAGDLMKLSRADLLSLCPNQWKITAQQTKQDISSMLVSKWSEAVGCVQMTMMTSSVFGDAPSGSGGYGDEQGSGGVRGDDDDDDGDDDDDDDDEDDVPSVPIPSDEDGG